MSTATAAPAAVHITIPGFQALFEGAVDWRACSAVAAQVAGAALDRRPPDATAAKTIWQRMMAAGQVSKNNVGAVTGANLANVHWYLTTQAGYTHLDWIDWSETPNLDAIHAMLREAALCSQPCILLLTNGQAAPDNEAGVKGHFICIGGIDSAEGYLVANGDTQTAIRTGNVHPPLNWAGWDTLKAAGVAGIIRLYPKAGQLIIPRAWSDSGSILQAPNGGTCGHGIRAAILATPGGWNPALEPVTGELGDAVGVHQDFRTNGDPHAAGVRLTWHESGGAVTSSPLEAIVPVPTPAPEPTPAPTPEPVPAPTPTPTPEPTPAPAPVPDPTPDPAPAPTPDYAVEIAALTAQLAHLATATQAAVQAASQAASNATEQATQAVAEAVAAAQAAATATTTAQAAQSDVASLRTSLKAL